MQSLKSLLGSSDFKMPDFTPQELREMEERSREWELEQERMQREAMLESSRIPVGYVNAEGALPEVIAWAESPTKGLLLQGGVGRGKTHNACIALRMAIDKRVTAKFVTFDDLLRECKATFKGRETEESVIGRYASCGMLCIDDMGKERVTEWSLPIIFSVINKRSMNLKPTIITTQYDGRTLMERLTVDGDAETARAIISRLMEYTRVVIDGKDWRRA